MIALAAIIGTFKDSFLAEYGDSVLPSQRHALNALQHCRSALSARMQTQCQTCQKQHFVPHSCGHRACPHCQHHESQRWLQRQIQRLVPGDYFLVTFTLPSQFRELAWRHQRTVYDAMMKSSWETLRTFSQNDPKLKGTPGAIAVLHTHSRRLDYHPHVHVLIPAAAMDCNKRVWRTKKTPGKSYLFSHKALAQMFRAKMLDALIAVGLALPPRHPKQWVVDCKAVGSGAKALIYLGRYLYRGVMAEKDILSSMEGQVTFRYRDSTTRQWRRRCVSGVDFLRLILRHVLPKRFRRARNFGFLHPNGKRMIALLQIVLKVNLPAATAITPRPAFTCPDCGGIMKVIQTRLAPRPTRHDHPPDGIRGCPAM